MNELPSVKEMTQNLVLTEPDEKVLDRKLQGRSLDPELLKFLKTLVKTNKWTKKITIPSTHNNVAVALLFTSNLKDAGLEILIEIHAFFDGNSVVEEWEMLPEHVSPSSLPTGIFNALDIEKVRVEGPLVHVELTVLTPDGDRKTVLKTYDFSIQEPQVETHKIQGDTL
jgi:hypothetical protein